ncbi:MAG: HEPN domain-containing protein [Acidimicrobiia bacterium]
MPRCGKVGVSTTEGESATPSEPDARQWLAKAQDDLTVAQMVRDSSLGVRWAACFHAQQAAEKALKALLVARGIDFPKSHALDVLAGLLEEADQERFERSALVELSPWAVAGRYPEDLPEPTADETRHLIEVAALVAQKVRTVVDPGEPGMVASGGAAPRDEE